MNQINVRINILTIFGFLLCLRVMQLNPIRKEWLLADIVFMIIAVGFIIVGDLLD